MRYYTTPPVNWPYLFVTFSTQYPYNLLYKRPSFKHAIVDCGVEKFQNPEVKEYPKGFFKDFELKAKYITRIFGDRVWFTIPDYCDDINPGQFGDNISKTIENVKRFIDIEDVNWVVSIQGRYENLMSLCEGIHKTKELIGEDYPRIALGTCCRTKKVWYISRAVRLVRRHFPKSWIHVFGITLNALPSCVGVIDSFDTSVWDTRRQMWSIYQGDIKSQFITYLEKINQIVELDNPDRVAEIATIDEKEVHNSDKT